MVIDKIKNLKSNKSPGISTVTNEMLKRLPLKYIIKITFLINAIIKHHHFPTQWKTAIIAPILKPDKPPSKANSYRPISLLNSIAKLTEYFIAQLVKTHINDNNILIPQQFGFREGLSATHQAYRLVDFITSSKINKQKTAAVFLDVSKAFDRVWTNGLLFKLINYKFPPYLIHLISSFLQNRNFHVRVKSTLSSNYPCQSGVPQGSILSPTLYNLFTNDIPTYPHTHLAIFADDTAIFAANNNRRYAIIAITKHLKLLSNYFINWKISINVDKTNAILFDNITEINLNKYKINYHNTSLPWSKTAKYLGITLDQKLTFKEHIHKIRSKFRQAKAQLYPLIGRKSTLSLNNKILLYKSHLRPILCYSSPVWAYAAKTHIKLLLVSQNSTLRQILDLPWYVTNRQMYRALKIPTLDNFIQKLSINFHNNLAFINNNLLKNISAYALTRVNRKRPRFSTILSQIV